MTQTSANRTDRADDKCACGVPLVTPSDGERWLLPTASFEPGYEVTAVVRCGEDPADRCAVRVPFGWVTHLAGRTTRRTAHSVPEVVASWP